MDPIYMTLRSRVIPLRNTAPKRKYTRAQKPNEADEDNDVVMVFHSRDPREIVDLTQILEQQDDEPEMEIGNTSSDSILLEDDLDNCDMLEGMFEVVVDDVGIFLDAEFDNRDDMNL
ncbi:hypothetical protein KR067_008763 [Drosophila pandora]|nr:hypothetical protein KR067_008763 [Drosophila pandora]